MPSAYVVVFYEDIHGFTRGKRILLLIYADSNFCVSCRNFEYENCLLTGFAGMPQFSSVLSCRWFFSLSFVLVGFFPLSLLFALLSLFFFICFFF